MRNCAGYYGVTAKGFEQIIRTKYNVIGGVNGHEITRFSAVANGTAARRPLTEKRKYQLVVDERAHRLAGRNHSGSGGCNGSAEVRRISLGYTEINQRAR